MNQSPLYLEDEGKIRSSVYYNLSNYTVLSSETNNTEHQHR